MKPNSVNNQPSFGRVTIAVHNNGRTGVLEHCAKIVHNLSKQSDKKIIGPSIFFNYKANNNKLDSYYFAVDCLKKDFSKNNKAESDLATHLKKIMQRNGIKADISIDA